jgi:uncharacterized protein YecT (DUF1311 family)
MPRNAVKDPFVSDTIAAIAYAAAIAVLATAPIRAAALPQTAIPHGQWRITAVHTDRDRTSRMTITPDDPALVGRTITATATSLTLGADTRCQSPSATSQTETLDTLIAATMAARPETAPRATGADYGIAAPNTPVAILWIACNAGQFGPADFTPHPGAWIVQTPGHALLIGWADSTILTATPIAATAATPPSFPCAAAHSASEHAICASPDLAAADRSVAASYADAKQWCDGDAAKLHTLAGVQNTWRQQRDRCGSDTACLLHSMNAQTTKLDAPGTFLGD